MVGNCVRLTLLCCSLFILFIQGAAPAQALDFSGLTLIYQEDFEGETGFPTLPEVNTLSVGDNSSIGLDGLNVPFPALFISGGAAIGSIHSRVPTAVQNVHVPATFSDSFGMRATFDSFSVGIAPADGSGAAGVVAVFGTLPNPTSVISASIGIARNFGSTTGFVILEYEEPPASPVSSVVALGPAGISAVLAGASFTVELIFDKDTLIATGSADIVGIGVITAPPLDVSAVAGISSSIPLAAMNLFLAEHFGFDADVRMEDLSVFTPTPPPATLIGKQVQIGYSRSGVTLQSDVVTVVQGLPELFCPGAFDLCDAIIPGVTQGNFDIESTSITLNVGPAGGSTSFAVGPFNGYIFGSLDLGVPITSIELITDIPGLTEADVIVFGTSVGVDLSGLTVDPGQFFTVELNPSVTPPPSVPALGEWGVLILVGFLFVSARRWVTWAKPSPERADYASFEV